MGREGLVRERSVEGKEVPVNYIINAKSLQTNFFPMKVVIRKAVQIDTRT